MLSVIEAFMTAHQLPDVAVVANAGMASEAQPEEIETAGLSFILGMRISGVPTWLPSGGATMDTIANGVNPAGLRGLVEVKSGSYVRAGAQIRAQLNQATDLGLPYNLVVGPETGVSAGLQQDVIDSGGRIMRFNPLTGLFSGC